MKLGIYVKHQISNFNRFAGKRYARSSGDRSLVLIFEKGGHLAGVQNVVPVEKTLNDKYYPFSTSPYYVKGEFYGKQVIK